VILFLESSEDIEHLIIQEWSFHFPLDTIFTLASTDHLLFLVTLIMPQE